MEVFRKIGVEKIGDFLDTIPIDLTTPIQTEEQLHAVNAGCQDAQYHNVISFWQGRSLPLYAILWCIGHNVDETAHFSFTEIS